MQESKSALDLFIWYRYSNSQFSVCRSNCPTAPCSISVSLLIFLVWQHPHLLGWLVFCRISPFPISSSVGSANFSHRNQQFDGQCKCGIATSYFSLRNQQMLKSDMSSAENLPPRIIWCADVGRRARAYSNRSTVPVHDHVQLYS